MAFQPLNPTQGYGDKHITLYDIRAELSCRYKDLRTPYRSPNTEEVFNMLTKETPETFYIGMSLFTKRKRELTVILSLLQICRCGTRGGW